MHSPIAIEVCATSSTGFEDAINRGLHQACANIRHLRQLYSAHVKDQQMLVESGHAAVYQVKMEVTFKRDSDG